MGLHLSDETARILLASIDARERAERALARARYNIESAREIRLAAYVQRAVARELREQARKTILACQAAREELARRRTKKPR
jgi:hypothetical protein